MKNIYKKSIATVAIKLVVSLFVLTFLHSCDKAKQFEDTKWECKIENWKIEIPEQFYETLASFGITEETFANMDSEITMRIYFKKKDQADVLLSMVTRTQSGFPMSQNMTGTATYTYKKKEISIDTEWKNNGDNNNNMIALLFMSLGMNGQWTGTVDKDTMELKNVFGNIFGETVEFTKQ